MKHPSIEVKKSYEDIMALLIKLYIKFLNKRKGKKKKVKGGKKKRHQYRNI